MNYIAKRILEDVRPEVLSVNIPALKDNSGNIIRDGFSRELSPKQRSIMIARTETIRASNEGALINYSKADINKVQWVAAVGERTCEYCMAQNGKILSIEEAHEQIGAHPNCRCSWAPIITKS